MKVLQAAHISDDEYFSHMVLDDLNLIIRDIREAHKKDSESAPQTTVADEPVSYTHLDVYKRQGLLLQGFHEPGMKRFLRGVRGIVGFPYP